MLICSHCCLEAYSFTVFEIKDNTLHLSVTLFHSDSYKEPSICRQRNTLGVAMHLVFAFHYAKRKVFFLLRIRCIWKKKPTTNCPFILLYCKWNMQGIFKLQRLSKIGEIYFYRDFTC